MSFMETKKQTAVELLIEKIQSAQWNDMYIWHKQEAFEEALKMEKHQIMNAIGVGSYFSPVFPEQYHYRAEDHYTSTYGK